MEPEHLGDGVYAQVDPNGIVVLTTGNHEIRYAHNVIYIDDQVECALKRYLERLDDERRERDGA
jgi:hypothetical protein